jgi:hypothetical protein
MGSPFTSYILSVTPSTIPIPTNDFIMEKIPLTSGVSSGGSQYYSMGNPPHEVPFFWGNIYPHMSNPYYVAFSLQVASSTMIPLQPFMNQLGGGYYPTRQGHGVYQNPSCPMISQNQSFPGAWYQMPQP